MITTSAAIAGAFGATGCLFVLIAIRGLPEKPIARPSIKDYFPNLADHISHARSIVIAASVGVGIATLWITRWPVAGLAAAFAVIGIPPLLGRSSTAALDQLEALAQWARRLSDILGSGAGGLEHALAASVRTCPPCLVEVVTKLVARTLSHGPEIALRLFAADISDPIGEHIAAVMILRAKTGGPGLRIALDDVAASITDEIRIRRSVEAERAKPRANMRAIVVITVAVGAMALTFARDYLSPFSTTAGQFVLAGVFAIFASALYWMHRLCQPPVKSRFLNADRPAMSMDGRP